MRVSTSVSVTCCVTSSESLSLREPVFPICKVRGLDQNELWLSLVLRCWVNFLLNDHYDLLLFYSWVKPATHSLYQSKATHSGLKISQSIPTRVPTLFPLTPQAQMLTTYTHALSDDVFRVSSDTPRIFMGPRVWSVFLVFKNQFQLLFTKYIIFKNQFIIFTFYFALLLLFNTFKDYLKHFHKSIDFSRGMGQLFYGFSQKDKFLSCPIFSTYLNDFCRVFRSYFYKISPPIYLLMRCKAYDFTKICAWGSIRYNRFLSP